MKINEKYVSKRIGERVAKLMEHFDSTIFWTMIWLTYATGRAEKVEISSNLKEMRDQIDWMLERVR
jgi:hypothetical protein